MFHVRSEIIFGSLLTPARNHSTLLRPEKYIVNMTKLMQASNKLRSEVLTASETINMEILDRLIDRDITTCSIQCLTPVSTIFMNNVREQDPSSVIQDKTKYRLLHLHDCNLTPGDDACSAGGTETGGVSGD